MTRPKFFLAFGLGLLLLGLAAVFFSQLIIEDLLQIERPFGQTPLSLKFVRAGLLAALVGCLMMVYGGWRNRRLAE